MNAQDQGVKYDFRTGDDSEPRAGWCLVKLAPNCHAQVIGESMTRDEAAMFAAAPDLLAACVEAHECIRTGGHFADSNRTMERLAAAIAKAKGNV